MLTFSWEVGCIYTLTRASGAGLSDLFLWTDLVLALAPGLRWFSLKFLTLAFYVSVIPVMESNFHHCVSDFTFHLQLLAFFDLAYKLETDFRSY